MASEEDFQNKTGRKFCFKKAFICLSKKDLWIRMNIYITGVLIFKTMTTERPHFYRPEVSF